ncbi:hypothetical protein CRV24_003019 [Beauveria bassiana]|nr:hypothetical protein CRV24_003019 [Beauveria bassiana]
MPRAREPAPHFQRDRDVRKHAAQWRGPRADGDARGATFAACCRSMTLSTSASATKGLQQLQGRLCRIVAKGFLTMWRRPHLPFYQFRFVFLHRACCKHERLVPASMRLSGCINSTDSDIRAMVGSSMFIDMPARRSLFLALAHITRRRALVLSPQYHTTLSHPNHCRSHFVPNLGFEAGQLDRAVKLRCERHGQIAQVDQAAILLYGIILSLPSSALVPWFASCVEGKRQLGNTNLYGSGKILVTLREPVSSRGRQRAESRICLRCETIVY